MKFKVKGNSKDSNEVVVSISDTALSAPRSVGQEITLETSEGTSRMSHQIKVVGDGLSVLVGHEVVRILPKCNKLKGSGLRIWHKGVPSQVSVKTLRPVEPKVTAAQLGGGPIKSPMTGKLLKVVVQKGDTVQEGQLLCVIEAMKMENQIKSECVGKVTDIRATEGNSVATGDVLIVIEASTTLK